MKGNVSVIIKMAIRELLQKWTDDTYSRCICVIPVQLITDDILSTVIRLVPPQLDAGAAYLTGDQAAGLAGDPLLGFHLYRS